MSTYPAQSSVPAVAAQERDPQVDPRPSIDIHQVRERHVERLRDCSQDIQRRVLDAAFHFGEVPVTEPDLARGFLLIESSTPAGEPDFRPDSLSERLRSHGLRDRFPVLECGLL